MNKIFFHYICSDFGFYSSFNATAQEKKEQRHF